MLDDFSARSRAIRAALELADKKPWHEITLNDVAATAGMGLAELRSVFGRKADILAAYQEEVDKEVLSRTGAPAADVSAKDRLLDVLMTRFEVMAPMRASLKSIFFDLARHPGEAAALVPSGLTSQYWMLAAAGIPASGRRGRLRVGGLAAIYSKIFPYWLNDESPGSEKTMAKLDQGLVKGEKLLGCLDQACGRVFKLAACFCPGACRSRKAETAPEAEAPSAEPPQAPSDPYGAPSY